MEFDWDEKTQGLVLSSFFWGYVVTQMPGGMLADTYGGKATLGLGMLFSSIGTIITPVVARSYGPEALIILRLIIGLAQVHIDFVFLGCTNNNSYINTGRDSA